MSDDQIKEATVAYLATEGAQTFTFKARHRIDVGEAITGQGLLADEATAPSLPRTMVRTTIVSASRSREGRAGPH